MSKTLIEAKGIDGQVELTTDRIIIHRKGLINMFFYGLNASHEIPLASISGVDFKNASLVTQGLIGFDHPGKSHVVKNNPSSVKFSKKQQPEFIRVKEKIFQIIESNRKQHI